MDLLHFFRVEFMGDTAWLKLCCIGSVPQLSKIIAPSRIQVLLSEDQGVALSSCDLPYPLSRKLNCDVSWRSYFFKLLPNSQLSKIITTKSLELFLC